ncbi:MAG: hypothetical protein PHR20_08215 [Bacteroidales bacterium]|nr:hypothetical protein [Bacteroidales bacterium]
MRTPQDIIPASTSSATSAWDPVLTNETSASPFSAITPRKRDTPNPNCCKAAMPIALRSERKEKVRALF